MSFAKRIIEAEGAKRNGAIGIAVGAKALRRCQYHEDIVLVVPDSDTQNAYRVGNAKFSAGRLERIFDSRRDMTDSVKAAIDDHALEDCPRCDKLLADY